MKQIQSIKRFLNVRTEMTPVTDDSCSENSHFCLSPLTKRQMPNGLACFNSAGSNVSGKFW